MPTYRPMLAGPNAVRLGLEPSSIHVIVNAWPAGILTPLVGWVILKGYESEIMGKSVGYGRKRSHGPKGQGQQEKELGERKTLLSFFEVERMSGREKDSERADGDGLSWQRLGDVRVKKKKGGTAYLCPPTAS